MNISDGGFRLDKLKRLLIVFVELDTVQLLFVPNAPVITRTVPQQPAVSIFSHQSADRFPNYKHKTNTVKCNTDKIIIVFLM